MKIGVDFDGTANAHPEFFSGAMLALQKLGHQVGIVTARPIAQRDAVLAWMRERGFPRPNFYIGKTGVEMVMPNIAWKRRMMNVHQIDYLFDDLDTRDVRVLERYP